MHNHHDKNLGKVPAPVTAIHLKAFLCCWSFLLHATSFLRPVPLHTILPNNSGTNPCYLEDQDAALPYHKQDHRSIHRACHAHPVNKKLISSNKYLVAQDKFYYEPNRRNSIKLLLRRSIQISIKN